MKKFITILSKLSRVVTNLVLVCAMLLGLFSTNVAYAADPGLKPETLKKCVNSNKINGIVTTKKVISFTFDDGPWPVNTKAIMDSFTKYSSKATFFMVGNNVTNNPSIARSVVSRGFEIGNHSLTHEYYSQSGISAEIAPAQRAIKSVTGVTPKYFRAPGGNFGTLVNSTAYSQGMCNIWTDSDLGDWRSPRYSSATLCSRFQRYVKPGSIILLHDGGSHTQTVNAVPCMLSWAKNHGYDVVPLSELLAMGRISGGYR